jgi:hypothetical protein
MAPGKLASLTVALAIAVAAPALAGGTPEQREACTPDAMRLCSMAIPDEGRVESCLRNAGPQLSAACRAVFYPSVAAPMQATRGQVRTPATVRAPGAPLSQSDDDN